MTDAYYNEIADYPAAVLRRRIKCGDLPGGRVDKRSIADVRPGDIGDGPAHFFAGIGGWPLALRWAGVPDDAPIWTGSCPCQPFSSAGKRRGTDDARHVWPVWRELIRECGSAIVFGEQVASRDGRDWLAAVRSDLESMGYAVGGADLPAAGVGAPHARQRLFWVAYRDGDLLERIRLLLQRGRQEQANADACGRGEDGGLGYADRDRVRPKLGSRAAPKGNLRSGSIGDSAFAPSGHGFRLGNLRGSRPQRHGGPKHVDGAQRRQDASRHVAAPVIPEWTNVEWVQCSDDKARPIESGTLPLAYGIPHRVGRIAAYGNAIVPQVAAVFVRCALDAIAERYR